MRLSACRRLRLRPLTGTWYRALRLKYWETRLSTDHSRASKSRFSAATPANPLYRILYLGENHQVVIFEVGALLGDPHSPVANPKGSWAILSLQITLDHVADLSDESQQRLINTNHQELTGDWADAAGVAPTQKLGAALHAVPGLEGFLYTSSRSRGRNLVIFPSKLGYRSSIVFHNEISGEDESLS
jgi:hypothetical protein